MVTSISNGSANASGGAETTLPDNLTELGQARGHLLSL